MALRTPENIVYWIAPGVTRAQIDEVERFVDKPVRAVAHIISIMKIIRAEDIQKYLPNISEHDVTLALAALLLYGLVHSDTEKRD